jgi:hypothetical protein
MRHYLRNALAASIASIAGGCYTGLAGSNGGLTAGADAADEGVDDSAGDDDGGAESGDTGADGCGEPDVGMSSLRRLNRRQYLNAVRDLLGVDVDPSLLPEDERADEIGPFASNVLAPLAAIGVRDYMDAAEAAAAAVPIADLVPCDPVAVGEETCARELIAVFGRRAFRRPLTPDEIDAYAGVFGSAHGTYGFDDAIGLVVETMLQAPQFLYMVEMGASTGDEVVALTDHELATRLSFFLWITTPDDELLAAADDGALATTDGIRAQAERLLASDRARDAIAGFHAQWLGVQDIDRVTKAPEVYPEFDADLVAMMADETASFTDHVVRHDDGRLETLLTGAFSFVHPRLGELYGIDPTDVAADGRVELPAEQRAGVLTHAAFLAVHAHPNQQSPIKRGIVIRENFLCEYLPPPPNDVDTTPPELDPNTPTRDRFDAHRDSPTCAGCHGLIDPIGYGLLAYDGIGRHMTLEAGEPIDDSGQVVGLEGGGAFVGAAGLARTLADSDVVRDCVVRQWITFAHGQPLGDADACTVDTLQQAFEASDGNIRELLLDIVVADSFRYRRKDPD